MVSLLPVSAALALAAACGGHIAATDDGGADGGTLGDGGLPPGFDGGPLPFDGGPGPFTDSGPMPPPPPASAYGYVLVQEDSTGGSQTVVNAVFSKQLSQTCALAQPTGTCAIASCNNTNMIPGLSAGQITVSGANRPATLTPQTGPNGVSYNPWQQSGQVWPTGLPLSFVATGGTVPAFRTFVSIPPPIMVTQPSLGGGTSIDTTRDLPVAWSGAPAGDVLFYLVDSNAQQTTDVLICFFAAAALRGVVPSGLLRQLRSTVTSGSAVLAVLPSNRNEVLNSGFLVEALTFGTGGFTQVQLR